MEPALPAMLVGRGKDAEPSIGSGLRAHRFGSSADNAFP
jgi:hypothetical protein